MAIAKLLLLLVVVIAQQCATTAPNVRPPTDQLREQRGAERAVPYFTAVVRTLTWSWAFLEGSVLFALSDYCPPALARPLLHFLLPSFPTSDLSPSPSPTSAFLTGALLTITGALLRIHCFHTLGPNFTFELAIRPSHTLVTSGAYAVVRHPSYTGGLAVAVGFLLCVLDRRGWVAVSVDATLSASAGYGVHAHGGGRADEMVMTSVWACVWATALGMLYVVSNKRMNKEDAMLEKNFGEEWRAWAKTVPYRLVPGVY